MKNHGKLARTRDALKHVRTYRLIVPLPPMRTEPASFFSFSTSMVGFCESYRWDRRRLAYGLVVLNDSYTSSPWVGQPGNIEVYICLVWRNLSIFRVRVLVRPGTHL